MDPLIAELIKACLPEVRKTVLRLERGTRGTRVLGAVRGRPRTEDETLSVDLACEAIFREHFTEFREEHDLRVRVYPEHGTFLGSRKPQFYCVVDPFDGSRLFLNKVRLDYWSVLSFFDLSGQPVAGGAVDILAGEFYLADEDGVTMRSLERESCVKVSPAKQVILDDNVRIACYLWNLDYLVPWGKIAGKLRERTRGAFIYTNGGACVWPMLASGRVDAYVMPSEPRSEIDPGLAFAKAAGITVWAVSENGGVEEYRFEPGKQAARVPMLVAACTEELARDIVEVLTA